MAWYNPFDWGGNNSRPSSIIEENAVWQLFGSFFPGQINTRGNGIIANTFERNIDVYSVINKILDTMKAQPWIVEQKLYNGEWKELKGTTLHDLMETPNATKGYTWGDIEEQLALYVLCAGNAYLYGEHQFNSTLIEELDVLPTAFITIANTDDFFAPVITYEFRLGRTGRKITQEQICHIKFFNPAYSSINESLYGLSPIQVAAMAVQAGNDRWDATAAILQNRGAIGILTDKSERPMKAEEAEVAQQRLDERIAGPKKYGKTIVSNKNLSFIQMAMSPQDLQLIEHGIITTRAICNVFGLDSSLFNDPENKTYSNRTEAEKALYTNAVIPLSNKIAQHLTRFICANHFPGKTVRMRQDFSKVECLQENLKEKVAILVSLKDSGVYTANEVRAELKKDAITDDENADVLIISANNTLQSLLGQPTQNPPAAAPAP